MTKQPRGRPRIRGTLEEFERLFEPELNTGCWLWLGAIRGSGYGAKQWIVDGERRVAGAHQISWLLYRGVWPSGHVLHRCDTPSCVNPDHLFLGDARANALDRARKRRSNQGALSKYDVDCIRAATEHPSLLAIRYHVSPQTIYAIKAGKLWGVRGRGDGVRRGTLHYNAKLDPEKVLFIRASTATSACLARQFGVSDTVIKHARARKSWKSVA